VVSLFPKSVALARRDGTIAATALIVTATALGVVT
jgi:hypothetical protein